MSLERRRGLVEPGHPDLSVVRQCKLLSVSRSGFYYQPVGETAENLALMRLIDAQYLEASWYGSLRLPRSRGRFVGLGATCRLLLFACWLCRP